jgi:FtsZ-binding cell division protein ZapB
MSAAMWRPADRIGYSHAAGRLEWVRGAPSCRSSRAGVEQLITKILKFRGLGVLALVAATIAQPSGLFAQSLDAAVRSEARINEDAAASQARVSELAEQAQNLLQEFRAVIRETESLRRYNDNLERVVNNQREEIRSINRQLAGLEETNRGVVPLMLEMIDTLGRIVEADIPFRIDQRRRDVRRLRDMMDRPDVTVSEKYRAVMGAYLRELEYGRRTEAYSDTLPMTGQTVDFLRVGRTLLLYQTSDGEATGWYNTATRQYEDLEDQRIRLEVRKGLAIARKERAPDLVTLPVPGPEPLE